MTNEGTYTLSCDRCGEAFYNEEAFPSPQLCPKCQLIRAEVERAAKQLCELDGHIWGLTSIPFMHKRYTDHAEQILLGHGLAKIVRNVQSYRKFDKKPKLLPVIPLEEVRNEGA